RVRPAHTTRRALPQGHADPLLGPGDGLPDRRQLRPRRAGVQPEPDVAQFWGQVSRVTALPEDMGWWSDVKVALRVGGAIGFPKAGRLFSLGGNMWFRGFDVFERQGSCMWVASVEVRLPV